MLSTRTRTRKKSMGGIGGKILEDRRASTSEAAHSIFPVSSERGVVQAAGPKDWLRRFRAWRVRRRRNAPRAAPQLPVPQQPVPQQTGTSAPSQVDPQPGVESDATIYEREDIPKYTKVTRRNERMRDDEHLRDVTGTFTRVESFAEADTGDNLSTPLNRKLNFENLYSEDTWIMMNNFRDKRRGRLFYASDVVNAQVRAAGIADKHVPGQIIRHHVVNKMATEYFKKNEDLVGTDITSRDQIKSLIEDVPNIRSTQHILDSRGGIITGIKILELGGGQYRITMQTKKAPKESEEVDQKNERLSV